MADGFVGVHQVSLRVPGTILLAFKQTHDFPGISSLEVMCKWDKSGLEPVCATNRPAELVVHDDKSHFHHVTELSPHHSPNKYVPVLALAGQRHVLVAFPLHQLCPCPATWNSPSKGRGLQRSVASYHMPVTPWPNTRGTQHLCPSYCSSYVHFTMLQSPWCWLPNAHIMRNSPCPDYLECETGKTKEWME